MKTSMTMMKHLLSIAACLAITPLWSQTLSGSITDSASMPIAFVNIGLANRPVGTISDSNGNFSLHLENPTDADTLRISCLGYVPQRFAVASLDLKSPLTIALRENAMQIPEVVVRPQTGKLRTFGRSVDSKTVSAGFKRGQEGGEVGIRCNLGKRSGLLKELRVDMYGSQNIDTLRFRINVYTMQGDRIGENRLTTPVYYSFPANMAAQTHSIDLTPYAIGVAGDFLISVENLTRMPESGQFWFRARLLARTYIRHTSQAPWKSVAVGIGISADVLTD